VQVTTPEDSRKAAQGARSLETRLVAAARRLLETQGLEAATLRATARAAGVSHMAPYRHFADKDALLAAVAEQGFRELAQSMGKAGTDASARLAIGVAYVVFALENPALYRLMFGANLVPRDRFPGLVAAGARAFEKCLTAAGAAAPGPGETPAAAPASAIALWALVHGLANLSLDGLVPLPTDAPAREAAIIAILAEMA
jgi:AcrR family transcriptional regulator